MTSEWYADGAVVRDAHGCAVAYCYIPECWEERGRSEQSDIATAARIAALNNAAASERERCAQRIVELEERVAELYRAQKNQVLAAKSFDLDTKLAAAIAAERERCAKIAERELLGRYEPAYLAMEIAAAIRKGEP